jgi:glycosyltransferase involved in cell wall biosynthesis
MNVAGGRRLGSTRRLRILLSAYACNPQLGSEPGTGWHWAVELARAGHEVWVMTRAVNQYAIEAAGLVQDLPGLNFMYYDLPQWMHAWSGDAHGMYLHYLLWQWGAYRAMRQLLQPAVPFDVVHHLTFGAFSHPSFLAFLDAPFVFGPVGGGEMTPAPLKKTLPYRGRLIDGARALANRAARFDPMMNAIYHRSSCILCKTRETLDGIPARYRAKCMVLPEVGIEEQRGNEVRRERSDDTFRVLYVGRLIDWKGLHLGLAAFARFCATHRDSQLTVIGGGPDEAWLHDLARQLGIGDRVNWMPPMMHDAVMQTYRRHDVFLYPSLHDASGNAVLEALACGLPVVCLDCGGPALLVEGSCGIRVPPGEPHQVIRAIAQALAAIADNGALARMMSASAIKHVHAHYAWRQQVARMERVYGSLPDATRAANVPSAGMHHTGRGMP